MQNPILLTPAFLGACLFHCSVPLIKKKKPLRNKNTTTTLNRLATVVNFLFFKPQILTKINGRSNI